MQQQKSGRICRVLFPLFLAAALILLPCFIAGARVLRGTADSIVQEVTNVKPYSNNPSLAVIHGVVRNEGKVAFDRIEGDLYLFRGDDVLYSCRTTYSGKVSAGEEEKVTLTVSNLREAEPLLGTPVSEMRYSWLPVSIRFVGPGFLFTHSFESENAVPWPVIAWPIAAAGALLTVIPALKSRKSRKDQEAAAAEESPAGSVPGYAAAGSVQAYSSAGAGTPPAETVQGPPPAAGRETAPGNPPAEPEAAPSSSVNKDALASAQRRLEQASLTGANYRSEGLTQNAELQDHFKREAFGQVLRESSSLSGRDLEAFDSARKSYEQASRFESSYRASGDVQKQNAEHAQYRRESAFAGMLEAVAEKDGRRSGDFDSAKKSYERESLLASQYRASGSGENAAEAEHRQRLAYAGMLKNSSDLDRRAADAYASAQRSYESASRSAASYRRQGMVRDAERAEHHMRLAEANMLKVKAESKGNGREFEDARRDFENASRHYMEYKSQGLERDANREKDYMDRAYAKMMSKI